MLAARVLHKSGKKNQKKMNPFEGETIPDHVAIILDGNGRWAQKHGLPRTAGHTAGSEVFRKIATHCKDIGIKYLTVYAFSTENWKRPTEEINGIMNLLEKYLQEAYSGMERDRVRFCFFGDLSRLSPRLQELIGQIVEKSKIFDGVQINMCLNYGGRDEILRATRRYAVNCVQGKADPDDLDENLFSSLLFSAGIPDPDLIIRPSGEKRLSNFLLWQCAYSELYFTDVLWPDFTCNDLDAAISEYNHRIRRYGGVL